MEKFKLDIRWHKSLQISKYTIIFISFEGEHINAKYRVRKRHAKWFDSGYFPMNSIEKIVRIPS